MPVDRGAPREDLSCGSCSTMGGRADQKSGRAWNVDHSWKIRRFVRTRPSVRPDKSDDSAFDTSSLWGLSQPHLLAYGAWVDPADARAIRARATKTAPLLPHEWLLVGRRRPTLDDLVTLDLGMGPVR